MKRVMLVLVLLVLVLFFSASYTRAQDEETESYSEDYNQNRAGCCCKYIDFRGYTNIGPFTSCYSYKTIERGQCLAFCNEFIASPPHHPEPNILLEASEDEICLGIEDVPPTEDNPSGVSHVECVPEEVISGEEEVCDGKDNNNNNLIDEGEEVDCASLECKIGQCSLGAGAGTGAAIGITGRAEENGEECFISVCSNEAPASANPFYIGPVYQEKDGNFKFKKYIDSNDDTSGWLMGNNINEKIREILKKTAGKISDDNTNFNNLKLAFGKTAKQLGEKTSNELITFTSLGKIPSGEGEGTCEGKEELPVRKEFWMKITDSGASNDDYGNSFLGIETSSEPIKASALFCPNGKLELIKSGAFVIADIKPGPSLLGVVGGVLGAIKGKISLIVKKAEVNYNGNGESNIDIQIEVNFKDLSKTVVGMILQFAPAFEGFDVRVTGETGEVIYSVLGDITELIKKNKLDESGIKNLNYNIMLKSENKKEGKIVEFNVIRTGDGGIYQVLHVLSLEQTKEFVKELIKKFQNTKVNLHTASCVASRRTQTTSIVLLSFLAS